MVDLRERALICKRPVLRAALAACLPIALLSLWQALCTYQVVNPLFVPSPMQVLRVGVEMLRSGDLVAHIAVTLAHSAAGFFLGSIGGLCCGLLMAVLPALRFALEPWIAALHSSPKITFLPLLVLLVGLSHTALLVPISLTAFVTMTIQGLDALKTLDSQYVELAVNYGAGRRQLLRRVYIPASLPAVFTGLRIAVGSCLVVAISVELLSGRSGLGGLIWMSWQTFAIERVFIGAAAASILGSVTYGAVRRLEAKFVPWVSSS